MKRLAQRKKIRKMFNNPAVNPVDRDAVKTLHKVLIENTAYGSTTTSTTTTTTTTTSST